MELWQRRNKEKHIFLLFVLTNDQPKFIQSSHIEPLLIRRFVSYLIDLAVTELVFGLTFSLPAIFKSNSKGCDQNSELKAELTNVKATKIGLMVWNSD